jgi:hypothetical protein
MNEEALYIGIPDKKINDIEDNITTNKIGGRPVFIFNFKKFKIWLNEKEMEHPKDLKCKICSSKLYLISQIYAPLKEFDRFLYIFACNNETCQNKPGRFESLNFNNLVGLHTVQLLMHQKNKKKKKRNKRIGRKQWRTMKFLI